MKSIMICAMVAFAVEMTVCANEDAYAPPGKDNIAFGYGAGYLSSGANTNVVVIGTDAGMSSANNRDCIFIGANAGAGMSGKSGAVVIGDDVFVHTNGVTTIKGFSGGGGGSAVLPQYWALANVTNASGSTVGANDVSALPATLDQSGYEYAVSTYVNFQQGLKSPQANILAADFAIWDGSTSGWSLSTAGTYVEHLIDVVWDGQYSPPEGAFLNKTTDYGRSAIYYGNSNDNIIYELATGENRMHFKFENGQFCVYTNGTKAGTLTFTPAQ